MWSTLAVLFPVKSGWRSFNIYSRERERAFTAEKERKCLYTSYRPIRPFTNVWVRTSSALYHNQPQQQVISFSEDRKCLARHTKEDIQILLKPMWQIDRNSCTSQFFKEFSVNSLRHLVHRNRRELRRGRVGECECDVCVHQTVVNFYLYWRRAC